MCVQIHPRGLSTEPLASPFTSLILLSEEPSLSPSNSTSGHTLPPSQPETGREVRGEALTPSSPTLEDPTARSLYPHHTVWTQGVWAPHVTLGSTQERQNLGIVPFQPPELLKREESTGHLMIAVLGPERKRRKRNILYLGSNHLKDLGKLELRLPERTCLSP